MADECKNKTCIACGQAKPANSQNFYHRNKERGWLSSWCIECRKAKRAETVDVELLRQRERRAKLRGDRACRDCGTLEKSPRDMRCLPCKSSLRATKKKADKCLYKSRLRKATPAWADKAAIRKIYAEKPEGCDVDHVIPIRGEMVSGLHVPSNLAYLTKEENMKKSNHYSLTHQGMK